MERAAGSERLGCCSLRARRSSIATKASLSTVSTIWGGERFRLRKPQNVAFAGPGKRTLYIVGSGAVFKVQTMAQGVQNRAK